MYLDAAKSQALSNLMRLLAGDYSEREVRRSVGTALLRLLDAQYFASYVWSETDNLFGEGVSINMDSGNLAAYEQYYQFHDPITHKLRARRGPTLVSQVMPQRDLLRTGFFNDFLARDGLYYGVNLHSWDRGRTLGDLRIWRAKGHENFDADSLELLNMIAPAFKSALLRARLHSGGGASTCAAAFEALSPRERLIAERLLYGLSDKEIAREFRIGVSTVRTHLAHMFEKLGARSRGQVIGRLLRPH